MNEHQQRVIEFLRKAEQQDPEKFKEICDKYPVLNRQQWSAIEKREKPAGLNRERENE